MQLQIWPYKIFQNLLFKLVCIHSILTTQIQNEQDPYSISSIKKIADCSDCFEDILQAVADCINAGDVGW